MVYNCRIYIGDYMFTALAELVIESTWQKFTDTAKITIPKEIYYREGNKLKRIAALRDIFKTGDRVVIQQGYNTEYVTDFEGYLARSPRETVPAQLECEDEMWQLKRKRVSVTIEDATVRQIIEAAAPGYEIDCVDEIYGDFSMADVTPVEIFDEIRRKAGLRTFFRGKRLVCGIPHSDPKITETVANFAFGQNIISSTLQYIQPEDMPIKIFGVSEQPDGSVIRVEVGEDGGDIERINKANFTEKQLKQYLENRLKTYKTAGGYNGSVTSFGFPHVVHGQTVRIQDKMYEQRDSRHFVDGVTIRTSATGGYRRILKIGRNAD